MNILTYRRIISHPIKGTVSRDFLLQFFLPHDPENNIRVISNLSRISQIYSQVKVHHRYQRHRWCTLSYEYLHEFSKRFVTALMGYSGAWGKLKKNLKSKISWHFNSTPSNFRQLTYVKSNRPPCALTPIKGAFSLTLTLTPGLLLYCRGAGGAHSREITFAFVCLSEPNSSFKS